MRTDFCHCVDFLLFVTMKRILIIDDHEEIRENIAEILMLGGFDAMTAPNGKRGVELAKQEKPDLIICDIMMPELDGYGVLHMLRRLPETEHIPFIFLTAKAERSDFRKGMEMGADDFITKPFDDVELLNAIETRFRKQEILQQRFSGNEQGFNELMQNLNTSGLVQMDPEQFDATFVSKKQLLYTEGKRPRFLYFLKQGKVKSFRVHEDGKEYITNLYTPGDYIGYIALLEGTSYEDSAEVLEDAELVTIPADTFMHAVFNDLTIAGKFIRLISNDVKEKEDRLLHLAYDSLRKRVAKALLEIQEKFQSEKAKQSIAISREDIAQYIGTATESLIRTLGDFKSEKLVEIKEGKIFITDPARLKNLLY